MISASEANLQTTDNLDNYLENEIEKIENKVIDAIKKGKYECYVDYLTNEAKKYLRNLGYKVETGSQYNQEYNFISWK